MVDYKAIQEFLNDGSYPVGYSKDQKRSLRRKAKLNFQFKSGVLCYSVSSVSTKERRWRRVIPTEEERHRIMKICHASAKGTHREYKRTTKHRETLFHNISYIVNGWFEYIVWLIFKLCMLQVSITVFIVPQNFKLNC